MTMTPRERLIGIVVVAAAALFALDSFVVEPFLKARSDLVRERNSLKKKFEEDQALLANRDRVDKEWKGLLDVNMFRDRATTAARGSAALFDWSRSAHFDLQSVKPDRFPQVGDFVQVHFSCTGEGSLANVARLLWSIETSPMPFHIDEIRLNARKEGVDDLAVQLSVSCLTFSPLPDHGKRSTSAAGATQ